MRPPVSQAASLDTAPDGASNDSDLVWLELDEIDELWRDVREVRELPADVAKVIRATAARLEDLDPYSLIGVDADADWDVVERAYRQRLAMFHPNRWTGYDLGDLRPSMETVAKRISFAFAFLAEEAAREGLLAERPGAPGDRPTRPGDSGAVDADLSGERPTFPSCSLRVTTTATKVVDAAPRARPPRPPPRRSA